MSWSYAIVWGATFAQLLPALPVVRSWDRVPIVRRWVAIWCVTYFLTDIVQFVAMKVQGNNLWLMTYLNPVEDAAVLWALSYWQTKPVARIAFRVGIPMVVIAYVILAIAAGELRTFQTISGTFRALVLLVAALFTFLSNLSQHTENATLQDWSWASLGIAIYFGLQISRDAIANLLGAGDLAVLRAVFAVKAFLDIIAFIIIWQGMRCPLPNGSSGSTSR